MNKYFISPSKSILAGSAGLCPLIAVSVNLISGLITGLLFMLVYISTHVLVSGLRLFIPYQIRIPFLLLISTTVVTVVHILVQTFFYQASVFLTIYIPLMAVNCFLFTKLEEVALQKNPIAVLFDSVTTGLIILLMMTLLGAVRELMAYGTLFQQMELLSGLVTNDLTIKFSDSNSWFRIVASAPGAFIGLGLLIAVINFIDEPNCDDKKVTT